MEFPHHLKEQPGQGGVVVIGGGVAHQKSMESELLHAQLKKGPYRLGELRAGHAELGLRRGVHNAVAHHEAASGVVAQAHLLGNAGELGDILHIGEIIQVDDGAQPVG